MANNQFPLITAQDMEFLPEPNWLISGMIPSGGLGIVVSAPGSGKSFLMLELANAIARQRGLFGNENLMPNTPDFNDPWVLVILPESAPSWGTRIKASRAAYKESPSDSLFFIIQPPNLAVDEDWADLNDTIDQMTEQRGEPPAVVIIDTLSASIPGMDENSQGPVSILTANLQDLVNKGTTVILTHHFGKYNDTYRGSSVLLGSVDWMIGIDVDDDKVRTLRAIKLRDAESITPLSFCIEAFGDGAVAVEQSGGGAWARFDDTCDNNHGLRDAWMAFGLTHPNGSWRLRPGLPDIASAGCTVGEVVSLWNEVEPLTGERRDSQREYQRRRSVVIKQAGGMVSSGILKANGELNNTASNRAKSLSVKITQSDAVILYPIKNTRKG